MRKPSEDDLSDEAADTGSVGDGFGGVVDFSESTYYGDSFNDDYTYDEDNDGSGEDEADDSFDEQETAFGDEVTETEAEGILEDMLDETYGPEAGEMVQSLEESSGMSAVEILEDITGMDLAGGQDADGVETFGSPGGGVGAVDPFDSPEASELGMATSDDFDLNRDGDVDTHDGHEATHVFDFDVTD